MKIAIDGRFIMDPPTGIGRVAVNLVRALASLATPADYAVVGPGQALSSLGDHKNVELVDFPYGHLSPEVHSLLPRLIETTCADLAHFMHFLSPWKSPTPYVVTVHDATYSRFPNHLAVHKRYLYNFFMRRSMARSVRVITASKAAFDDILVYFPSISRDKIRVVYNGVESRFQPHNAADAKAAKNRLGLPDRYILYVGNHRPHKNLPRLISAFSRIATDVDHQLVLSSARGAGADATFRAVAEWKVADRMAFRDISDDKLPEIYSLADAFVFPSLSEGFGLPALEAMACGTPVITSNTSSLPEVVGEAGIMVDPYDVEQLADAMLGVLTNRDLRQDLREKGIARSKLFSWEETARQTFNVYKEVLKQSEVTASGVGQGTNRSDRKS